MAAVVKTSYYLLAILSAALGDRTWNRPGCAEIAFSGENKYLACSYTSGADTPSSCEGYTAASSVALGGTVVWTLNDYTGKSFSVSTDNFTSTHSAPPLSSTPFVNISTDTGELYIDIVSPHMRGHNRTFFNCSILDSEGHLCGVAMNEIIISIPEESVWIPPIIYSPPINVNEALIGRRTSICLEGTIGGTNGDNFWTFNDTIIVNATDISNLTNPGNSNFLDFTQAICETCSCVEKYSALPSVESMLSENLRETGFASFIVTMFVTSNTDVRNRLCYGVPNRFVTVLMVEEVKRAGQGPINLEITLTSAQGNSLRRSIGLQAYYYQPTHEIEFQLFPSREVVLERGDRTVILCNATAAGNSAAQLHWRTGDNSRPVFTHSPGLLSASSFTEDFLREVCVEGPGVFSVTLPGELGPSSDLAFPGAVVLNLYAALVLCEAQPSFSGAYICSANSSQREFRAVLTISISVPHVNILPYAVAAPMAIIVLTVFLIVLIVWCAWCWERKRAPRIS